MKELMADRVYESQDASVAAGKKQWLERSRCGEFEQETRRK